jgi:hypothetical protein
MYLLASRFPFTSIYQFKFSLFSCVLSHLAELEKRKIVQVWHKKHDLVLLFGQMSELLGPLCTRYTGVWYASPIFWTAVSRDSST